MGSSTHSSNDNRRLLIICVAAAVIAAAIACCYMLYKRGVFGAAASSESAASSASSEAAASSEAVFSRFGKVADFDYQNFSYGDGLDENGYWSGVRASDYVTLPADFASIAVSRAEVEPTEEELQSQLEYIRSQNATTSPVTDRAAAEGDTVNIDYSGSVGGVVFNGGTAQGYDLTLGSNTFIDGFETQIVGHSVGETFDITVTFPEGYGTTTDSAGNTIDLSGAEAVFTVTLNSISETVLPELTDEWVNQSFGDSTDIRTVEQLREFVHEYFYTENLDQYIMNYLLENSEFKELPKVITDNQANQCLAYYYSISQMYGCTFDELVQTAGYADADALLASMDDNIELYTKEALIYQAVAEQLGVEPTQEQIDNYAGDVATYGENYCRMAALIDAVSEKLISGAVVE